MKKRLLKIGVLLGLASTLYGVAFAEGQSCETCSNTSQIIEQYIKFSNEMLETLKNMANDGQGDNGGEGDQTIQNIVERLNNKGKNVVTYAVLLGTIHTELESSTTREELEVMTNAKALMRDRKKLEKIDDDIAEAIFELGEAGLYTSMPKDYQQKVSEVLKKYGEDDSSFMKASGAPSSAVGTLMSALRALNQSYKRFIAGGYTDAFKAFTVQYKDDPGITLTDVNYKKLVEEYKCARGFNSCDSEYEEYGEDIDNINEENKPKTNELKDKLRESLRKWKCKLSSQTELDCEKPGFNKKQNQLLQGVGGIEKPPTEDEDENIDEEESGDEEGAQSDEEGDEHTEKAANKVTNLGNGLSTTIDGQKEIYSKDSSNMTKVQFAPEPAPLDIITPDSTTNRALLNLYAKLNSTVDDTLEQSKASWQKHVLADPLVVTKKIPAVSSMVHDTTNLIGDGQKDKSITKNLNEACEYQCTNVGGKCSY